MVSAHLRLRQRFILIVGVAGVGKTRFAKKLADSLEWGYFVNSEVIKDQIRDEKHASLTGEDRDRAYELIEEACFRVMKDLGKSVVTDAPYTEQVSQPDYLEKLKAKLEARCIDAEILVIHITADPKIIKKNLHKRGAARDKEKLAKWGIYVRDVLKTYRVTWPHLEIHFPYIRLSQAMSTVVEYIYLQPEEKVQYQTSVPS